MICRFAVIVADFTVFVKTRMIIGSGCWLVTQFDIHDQRLTSMLLVVILYAAPIVCLSLTYPRKIEDCNQFFAWSLTAICPLSGADVCSS